MPGKECVSEDSGNSINKPNIMDLFGFFYCNVSCDTHNYFGLLTVRDPSGIRMPVGE
jgi:hypothetical protein